MRIATAAVLYNGSRGIAVGHRRLVEFVNVYSGFALPVPLLVVLLGSGLLMFPLDLARLSWRTGATLVSTSS